MIRRLEVHDRSFSGRRGESIASRASCGVMVRPFWCASFAEGLCCWRVLSRRSAYMSSVSRSKGPACGSAPAGDSAATRVSPRVWRSCCSMAAATSGWSLRYFLAFSRPWPIRSSWYAYQAPLLWTRACRWRGPGGPPRARSLHRTSCQTPPGGTAAHFVLHHLGPYAAADHLVPLFDLADPPDIQADGGVKFQGIAPVVVSGLPTNMPIFCRS